MNLHIILIPVGIALIIALLWIRNKLKYRKDIEAEEKAKVTVKEILEKTEQITKEELKEMKPDEKIERWKELYDK